MDNWLLFLIIGIGIISSFLNKKTKTISQGPISNPKETPTINFPDSKEEVRRIELANKRTETKRVDPAQHFEGRRETEKGRVRSNDAYSSETTENLMDFHIEPNKVAQGMIWSEILGPPRSKRAHSIRKR